MSDYKKDFEKSIDFIEWQNDMLKKQADRIAELEKQLKHYKMAWNMAENELETQTKPLSDEEINKLIVNKVTDYELCRAIEERHGIK